MVSPSQWRHNCAPTFACTAEWGTCKAQDSWRREQSNGPWALACVFGWSGRCSCVLQQVCFQCVCVHVCVSSQSQSQLQLLLSSWAFQSVGTAVDFVYPQVVIFCETISRRIAFCCRRQQRKRRRQGRTKREMETETSLISPASVCRICSIAFAFAWALLIAFPDFGCKGIIMLRMRPVCDPLLPLPLLPSCQPRWQAFRGDSSISHCKWGSTEQPLPTVSPPSHSSLPS